MLSLQDCIAMTDIPDDKLLELARREHLPVMLAVALAAQRGSNLVQRGNGDIGAAVWQGNDVTGHTPQVHRAGPTPK